MTEEVLSIPRAAFVALKRSIDPHLSDKSRYEILRDDFNAFWEHVVAADKKKNTT